MTGWLLLFFAARDLFFVRVPLPKNTIGVALDTGRLCSGRQPFLRQTAILLVFFYPGEVPSFFAATEVVPEPEKGSSTTSCSFVLARIILASSFSGFCVG